MELEELFCKLFSEYAVNGKPLSPYFDLFESGYEQSVNRIEELEKENKTLRIHQTNAVLEGLEMEVLKNSHRDRANNLQDRLTNAKEIIKKLKALYLSPVVTKDDVKRQDEILAEAEQFLKDKTEQEEPYYVIMNMNCQYEICRKCPKSGLFKGSYEECEKWIEQKKKEEQEIKEK